VRSDVVQELLHRRVRDDNVGHFRINHTRARRGRNCESIISHVESTGWPIHVLSSGFSVYNFFGIRFSAALLVPYSTCEAGNGVSFAMLPTVLVIGTNLGGYVAWMSAMGDHVDWEALDRVELALMLFGELIESGRRNRIANASKDDDLFAHDQMADESSTWTGWSTVAQVAATEPHIDATIGARDEVDGECYNLLLVITTKLSVE
jgi:hypothetical protein